MAQPEGAREKERIIDWFIITFPAAQILYYVLVCLCISVWQSEYVGVSNDFIFLIQMVSCSIQFLNLALNLKLSPVPLSLPYRVSTLVLKVLKSLESILFFFQDI